VIDSQKKGPRRNGWPEERSHQGLKAKREVHHGWIARREIPSWMDGQKRGPTMNGWLKDRSHHGWMARREGPL
jgi:hypothetical protein